MARELRLSADSGFTFLEVIVAMFILSFIVGELAMISMSATRTAALAQRLTRANMIAEAILETCRNTAFEKLDTEWFVDSDGNNARNGEEPMETKLDVGPPWEFTWDYDLPNGMVISPFERVRSVAFKKYDASENAVAAAATTATWADITVTVSWVDRGVTQQVQIASRISKF